MSGAAASWSMELMPAAKATLAAPRGTSRATATGSVGAAAATSATAPNPRAATVTNLGPTYVRLAVASAPATEPAPIATASAV